MEGTEWKQGDQGGAGAVAQTRWQWLGIRHGRGLASGMAEDLDSRDILEVGWVESDKDDKICVLTLEIQRWFGSSYLELTVYFFIYHSFYFYEDSTSLIRGLAPKVDNTIPIFGS